MRKSETIQRGHRPERRLALTAPPTLIASGNAGARGPVRVWTPSRWRLHLPVGFWASFVVASIVELVVYHPGEYWNWLGRLVCLGVVVVLNLAPAICDACSPYSLAADRVSLCLARRHGSAEALRWQDVVSAWRVGEAFCVDLDSDDGERSVEFSLAGYSRREQDDLFRWILEAAHLQGHPSDKDLAERPQLPEGPSPAQPRPGLR